MSPLKRNPVFWLMWMIPGAAVLAGLGMVGIILIAGIVYFTRPR